jgi:predicted extracellular nuclease
VIGAALLGGAGAACEDASTNKPPTSLPAVDGGSDAAGRDPEGKAPLRPGSVRVATFNVRLFFDQTCDSGSCGASDFEKVATAAGYAADVERIAIAIAKIDPDVIALEEIETQACLDDLVAKLAQKGLTYPVAHLGEIGTGGSVDVAVLARGTLGEVKTHRDTPLTRPDGSKTTFSRELLEVRFDLGGRKLAMFAAHFRSKASDDPGRRLAEAKATQTIMTATAAELPDALVALGGDLNDEPGSEPINAMEAGGDLVRLAAALPPAQQGTYTFQGKVEAIDHLFVAKSTAARYVDKSIRVVRDATTGGLGSSDHAALSADLSLE